MGGYTPPRQGSRLKRRTARFGSAGLALWTTSFTPPLRESRSLTCLLAATASSAEADCQSASVVRFGLNTRACNWFYLIRGGPTGWDFNRQGRRYFADDPRSMYRRGDSDTAGDPPGAGVT